MQIALSLEQQQRLLSWAQRISRAHGEADVEPSGYTLHIDVGTGAQARATWGASTIDLGDVAISICGSAGEAGEQ